MSFFFKPFHDGSLKGACVSTLNPRQKGLCFLSPRLGTKGDSCRKSRDEWEEFAKKRARLAELNEKKEACSEEEIEEKKQLEAFCTKKAEAEISENYAIESLKQQYYLVADGNDTMPKEKEEIDRKTKETFQEYFCEDDLMRIPISIQIGREYQMSEAYEAGKKIVEKKGS